jgi:hypothetical protein
LREPVVEMSSNRRSIAWHKAIVPFPVTVEKIIVLFSYSDNRQ